MYPSLAMPLLTRQNTEKLTETFLDNRLEWSVGWEWKILECQFRCSACPG